MEELRNALYIGMVFPFSGSPKDKIAPEEPQKPQEPVKPVVKNPLVTINIQGDPDADGAADGMRKPRVPRVHIMPIVDQSWSLDRIAREAIIPSWRNVFDEAMSDILSAMVTLQRNDIDNTGYLPLKRDIFNAFNMTPLNSVKVIIIGQDPYPQILPSGSPRATGLSFSARKEDKIPASLSVIYKELVDNIPGFIPPSHGDLSTWAQQGVLLLNQCLTVRAGVANSHKSIWMGFTTKILRAISSVRPNAVYFMWGKEAQKLMTCVGDHAYILTAPHPSPMNARRGFYGCEHFKIANEYLVSKGETPINWNSLSEYG